jgi:hypothetical protein
MHYDVRQPGDARQTGGAVKIGQHGDGASTPPPDALLRITKQRENPIVSNQPGQGATRHITAADNQ